MAHSQSVRMAAGQLPSDLKRKPWNPDRGNIEREPCTEVITTHRVLVCYKYGKVRRAILAPNPKLLLGRKGSRYAKWETCQVCEPRGDKLRYALARDINIDDLTKDDLREPDTLPPTLKPVAPACGHKVGTEVIRCAMLYIDKKPNDQNWSIVGVLPEPPKEKGTAPAPITPIPATPQQGGWIPRFNHSPDSSHPQHHQGWLPQMGTNHSPAPSQSEHQGWLPHIGADHPPGLYKEDNPQKRHCVIVEVKTP
jgi:hypothetical protein